ncbi:MAG: CehA/McbA family metallohydrolase [Verrucomicrobia bacterium]|nr:CehA/McbA family metallohydrolase [Verrucomicrobiota bacterium]
MRINATVPGVGTPVAVRAIIRQSNGAFYEGEWGDSSWPNVALRGKAVGPANTLQVPPGTTVITVGKGPDYLPQTVTVNLPSGQTTTINVALQPVLNMLGNGWTAGDIHTHYNHGEGQVFRTPQQVHNVSAAGGLNFVSVCQEHYGATTLTRREMFDAWSRFDSSECQVWIGAEEPKNAWGHHASIVDDPWRIRSPLPYYTGIHEVHRQGGVTIPVHPLRSFPGKSYGNSWMLYPLNNFYKAYPLQALTGNLIDGWGGVSDEAHQPNLLPPYFELLNMGYRIPLMADSDIAFDRINNGSKAPGNWINYFRVDGALNKASVVQAIKRGRVISTTGPMLLFNIDGARPGDTLPADGASRTARIQASYLFNPWTLAQTSFNGEPCRVVQVDLFRNGQVIQTWNPNTPTATLEFPINETSEGSHYMVRVLGNDAAWMAAYASPIYFDNTPRPRQPDGFTSLVNGRVYDAANNHPTPASVSCVRDGETLWNLQTDSQGLFRAYVPLDAKLVARDANGRQIGRDILSDERVYAFCHNLPETFPNLTGSIAAFRNLVKEMTWEFPLGHQNAASYVRQPLSGNAAFSNFSIQSAPARTPGKNGTEITTLLVDRTRAQRGETINYAVLFRTSGGAPNEELSVEWKSWDPDYPRLYTKHGKLFHHNNASDTLVSLGNGFYLRQGSVVVPSWAGNVNDTSPGLKMAVTARGAASEEANLLITVGPSRPELLVSSTWDGFPATWGEFGVGPCYFHRQLTSHIRYNDYRQLQFSMQVNGQTVTVHPLGDTAHANDADNALFEDHFFYDGQLGSQGRNIPYRDEVRGQPAEPNFANVAIFNSQDQKIGDGENDGGDSLPASTPLPIAKTWFGPHQGNAKLVFWEHKSGKTAVTHLSVTNFVTASFLRDGRLAGAGWRARTVADLNNDGSPDLIWKHDNGKSAAWFMQGAEFASAIPLRNGHAIAANWNLVGSGDISNNGKADLLWQHADGRLVAWLMDGPNFSNAILLRQGLPIAKHWRFSGITDLDRNGSGDILWHNNDNNTLAAWMMDRTEFQNASAFRSVGSSWKLVGAADFNGDNRDDFLWQNTDGRLAIWFMDGTTLLAAYPLIPGNKIRLGWRIVGAK